MPANRALGYAIARLLDLIYPPRCLQCSSFGEWLCSDCLSRSTLLHGPTRISGSNADTRTMLVWSVGTHQGILRRAVHELKYEGMRVLAEPMGGLMARTWREHELQADCIVPVPLHDLRRKERGYNQSQLLANALAAKTGVAANERALVRVRDTPTQVGLSALERLANVRDAFRADEWLAGKRVILVDDVCTSGSTLLACGAAVEAATGRTMGAMTFARAGHLAPDI